MDGRQSGSYPNSRLERYALCNVNEWKDMAERGGILSKHPKKFSVAMVKLNSNAVNLEKCQKPFYQCY
jgi:hypothetical protein